MFDPIKNINDHIFSNNEKKILDCVKSTISYCRMLLSEIRNKIAPASAPTSKTQNNEFMKKIIIDHMYILYYCFQCIGIMKLVSKIKILDKVDQDLEGYLNDFFSSKETYTIFLSLKNSSPDEDELIFFNNLISKCLKYQKFPEIQKEIRKLTENINNNLENLEKEYMDITPEMKKYIGNHDRILLNRKNYYYLQRKIHDSSIRKQIESIYLSKSDKSLGSLERLITLRTEYANKMGYETYFDYVTKDSKQINTEETFKLINDHVSKISLRARKETKRIQKKLSNKKKVETHDLIYYYETMASQYLFSLEHSLKVIFDVIKYYFDISFVEMNEESNLWGDIKTFKVYGQHKKFLGYVYMDLIQNNEKNITTPICIHMSHEYTDVNNNNYDTKICILGGYDNYSKKSMKHIDVISLFREMGNCIQFLMYTTKTGNMISNDEFYSLTSKIMEHIFWEKKTLTELCSDVDKKEDVIDHILFTRYIDYANSTKFRCINSYFDLLIHSSKMLITALKDYGQYNGHLLKDLYEQTFRNVMASQKDIFEINTKLIHPIVIFQEVNGMETKVYENIIVEILSYNIFAAIKNNNGKKYIKILSKAHMNDFKNSLDKFVNKLGDNYNSYLKEIIGYSEIDTDANIKIKKNNHVVSTDMSVNGEPNIRQPSIHQPSIRQQSYENIVIDRKLP
jgi:hypothetical protein